MSGADGEATLRANRDGFDRYQLRARRFVDVSKIDLSVTVFGQTFSSPIALCPIGSAGAFHADGEKAAAAAARTRNQLMMLSTQATFSVEDATRARGGPIWYQLYTTSSFEVTKRFVKRAEAAGCPVVAVTIDTPNGRNTVTATRGARLDPRQCSEYSASACHPRA